MFYFFLLLQNFRNIVENLSAKYDGKNILLWLLKLKSRINRTFQRNYGLYIENTVNTCYDFHTVCAIFSLRRVHFPLSFSFNVYRGYRAYISHASPCDIDAEFPLSSHHNWWRTKRKRFPFSNPCRNTAIKPPFSMMWRMTPFIFPVVPPLSAVLR